MFKLKRLTYVLGCTFALTGCASYLKSTSLPDIEITPVNKVSYANTNPKIMYFLGRYYQGKANYDKAIGAYKEALALNPDYVQAHNGLGVIYAIQGKYEQSLYHFDQAMDLAPDKPYLYNNKGYAFLIQGNETEAADFLRKALQLDPMNKQARTNLITTYNRVGLYDEAEILALASKPALATNKGTWKSENNDEARIMESGNPEVHGNTGLVKIADNVYEFRADEKDPITELIVSSELENKKESVNKQNFKMEVSNGNGVTGMARKVSEFLYTNGFSRKARLTNYSDFKYPSTVIFYRQGKREQAKLINDMLPNTVKMIETDRLREDIHVQLLLGHDIKQKLAYFDNDRKKVLAKN